MNARNTLAGAIGAAIFCGAVVAGCSSGGNGTTAPQMPTVAATAVSTGSSGTTSSSQTASVSVSIPITQKAAAASSRRNPAFVSPGAAYVSFVAEPGSVGVGDVQCTSNACTGTLQVPVATTSISAQIVSAGGYLLATATQPVTILVGHANTVNFVFNGVVRDFVVALPTPLAGQQFAIGVSTSFSVTMTANDATGNQITTAGGLADASGNVLVSADGTTQTMSLASSTSHVSVSPLTWNAGTYTLSGTVSYDGTNTGSSVVLTPTSSLGDTYAYDDASVPENPKELEIFADPNYTIPTLQGLTGTGTFPAYVVEPQTQPYATLVEFGIVPPSPVHVQLDITANFNDAGATLALGADNCSNQINTSLGTDNSLQAALPSPGPNLMPAGNAYVLSFPAGTNYVPPPTSGACSFSVNDTTNGLTATATLGFDSNQIYVQGRKRK
jgi:hypothetical protein